MESKHVRSSWPMERNASPERYRIPECPHPQQRGAVLNSVRKPGPARRAGHVMVMVMASVPARFGLDPITTEAGAYEKRVSGGAPYKHPFPPTNTRSPSTTAHLPLPDLLSLDAVVVDQ